MASSTNLFVIPFPSKKTEKDEPEPEWEAVGTALPTKEGRALAVEKVIERPETESGVTGTFRAAKFVFPPYPTPRKLNLNTKNRFNPQSDRTAYTVLNTTPLRKSNSKGERKAYIHVFEIAESGAWAVKKHLMVSPRPITVFDVRCVRLLPHPRPN